MDEAVLDRQVGAVRRFNRFYTQKIGVLEEGHLKSPFTLSEVRILYELAHRGHATAGALAADLGLDQGYLSRILKRFQERGLITRTPAPEDGRSTRIALTPAGREAFTPLERTTEQQIGALLGGLDGESRRRLLEAMGRVETLLGGAPDRPVPYILRPHRPGDLGWIVHRHGALYAEEYGWDTTFEALVAEVVAEFARGFDPGLDRCWVAERDGGVVGSIFLVHGQDPGVGKLRLLYVEPAARGLGIGARLVRECVDQAVRFGYRRLTLWTNDVLVSARRIYQAEGFRLLSEEPHHSFGKDLVGQTWVLDL